MKRVYLIIITMLLICPCVFSQVKGDSLVVRNDSIIPVRGVDTSAVVKRDTVAKKKHSPKKAAVRSAIIPGWGQVYNGKIWKVPIVYAALGTTAAVFIYNLNQYHDIRYAYTVLVNEDTANYKNVAPELQDFVKYNATNDLFNARSEVRQNIDYSVLVFLMFWGLNVVDALVDAHLKEFDVSPDLSMKIKPKVNTGFTNFNAPAITNVGLSVVFDIHKSKPKPQRSLDMLY